MKVELVTLLEHQANKIRADLHDVKETVLVTEHGRPSAGLVDVDDYDAKQNWLAILEGLAKGEHALADGKTVNHEMAKDRMSKWLK